MRNNAKSGFTLLEMMISFVILAIAVTSIYQSLTTGLTTAHTRLQRYEATEIAISLIAEFKVIRPPLPASGEIGNTWRWEARIEPIAPVEMLPPTVFFQKVKVDVYSLKSPEPISTLSRILPAEGT